jgi:hypothetical protein
VWACAVNYAMCGTDWSERDTVPLTQSIVTETSAWNIFIHTVYGILKYRVILLSNKYNPSFPVGSSVLLT